MIEILRKINIKKRLEIYFIIASVLPILLMGITCSIINFNKMEQNAINYSNNITKQTKINIKSYFEIYINRLKSMSSDKTLVNDLKSYNKSNWKEKEAIENRIRISLASTFGGDSDIESVEICTYENLRFYYTSPISYGDINGKNSSTILKKSQSNDITSNLLKKEVNYDDKLYTIISKQIKDENNQFVGVILLALNKEFIDKVCVENLSVNGSNLILLDESKNIISTSNDKLNKSYYKKIISAISNNNDKKDRDISSKVKVDNQDMVLSYEYYDTIGWTIINLIPYNYLMNNTIKLIIITCIIASIIAFIAFKLSKIITKSIYDPINSLISAMNNTNIENRVKYDSADEYGILIDGFNKMNTKINSTINDVYEHKLKELKLNAYKKEAELASLQKQINPHFLYNTIESIYWNCELNRNTELCDMILSLGDYLRSIINKGREYILIKSEIESVNNYIFLQNKRFEYGISCNWLLSNAINNMYILKLMIQPIIDDIVSYSMENCDSLIKINIEIVNKYERLDFIINNDSVTYFLNNVKVEDANVNLGINNVDQRLKLYFGNDFGIKIDYKNEKIIISSPIFEDEKVGGNN